MLDGCQFLNELPDGDTAINGQQGRGGFRGLNAGGAATTQAATPLPRSSHSKISRSTFARPRRFRPRRIFPLLELGISMCVRAVPPTGSSLFPGFGREIRFKLAKPSADCSAALAGRSNPARVLTCQPGPLKVTLTDIHPGSSFDVLAAVAAKRGPISTDADLKPLQYPDDIVLLEGISLRRLSGGWREIRRSQRRRQNRCRSSDAQLFLLRIR